MSGDLKKKKKTKPTTNQEAFCSAESMSKKRTKFQDIMSELPVQIEKS